MRSRFIAALSLAAGCAQTLPQLRPGTSSSAFPVLALAAAGAGTGASKPEPNTQKLTLRQAYELALAHSEQVSLAERAVELADIEHGATWDAVTPDVRLTGTATLQRERTVGTNVITPGQTIVGAARIQQPLFRRGFFASREAGEQRYHSAQATTARAHEQLARDVAEVFITALRSRKLLELAQTAVTRANTQYDLAVGRVKAGQALKNAELLAVIDLRRAERQAVEAQSEVDEAAVEFRRLVGQDPPADLEMPPMVDLPPPEQAAALAGRRHDIRALELSVSAASSAEDAAAGARWWPRFDLEAGVSVFSPNVLKQSYSWEVLGIVTIPILQSGTETTEIARRANQTHVAQLELEQQRKLVVEELTAASIRAASAAKISELAEKQLEAARENYKLVDKQVRLGAITFLEVTNAQAVLVEAENASEIARMDRMLAVYDYLFAIGALDLTK